MVARMVVEFARGSHLGRCVGLSRVGHGTLNHAQRAKMLADLQLLYSLPLTILAPLIVVVLFVLATILVAAYVLITAAIQRRAEKAARREARDSKRRMSRCS
jgi:hypothetical protein